MSNPKSVDRVLLRHLSGTRSGVSVQRLQSLASKDIPGLTRRRFVNSVGRLVKAGNATKAGPHRLKSIRKAQAPKKKAGVPKLAKPKKALYSPGVCKGVVDAGFILASDYEVVRDPGVDRHTVSSIEQVWDVMLNHRDLGRGIDKFFAMQLLQPKIKPAGPDEDIVLLMRHGRTGTHGVLHVKNFAHMKTAKAAFQERAQAKAGLKFVVVVKSDEPEATNATWQYFVDDGVDNKTTGWYNYEPEASRIVESIHREWLLNPHLDVRRVQSGKFAYHVDFGTMTQTNVTHDDRKQRSIRRSMKVEQ